MQCWPGISLYIIGLAWLMGFRHYPRPTAPLCEARDFSDQNVMRNVPLAMNRLEPGIVADRRRGGRIRMR